jgi:N-acetylmuramoyl-L-alanine amidase
LSNKFNTCLFFLFLVISFAAHGQSSQFKVAIDAGHGGHDPGAMYSGRVEKEITLGVALKVGEILEAAPGIDVTYTRKTDVFIELVERANIANRSNADVFVSIHCNANKDLTASGTETYVMGKAKTASAMEAARRENSVITLEKDYKQKYEGYDPKNPESQILIGLTVEQYMQNSIELAAKVQGQFEDKLGKKNRGVKPAPYMVLHKAAMPRILIEMGFVSNPSDGSFLNSEDGQQQMARAIADAIISYQKEYYGIGFVEPEATPSIASPPKNTPAPIAKPDTVKAPPVVKAWPAAKPVKAIPAKPVAVPVMPKPVEPVFRPVVTPVIPKPAEPVAQPVVTPQVPSVESIEPVPVNNIIFKVQLAAGNNKLNLTPANFNGLGAISMISEGGKYKYLYGQTTDYTEAQRLQAEARSKGYLSAFLVAFRDGSKITVDEALRQ